MKRSRAQRSTAEAGYSLAEMLTVIAMIGVLTLVTVPAFMNFYQQGKVKASMRNFTSDIRRARALAITSGRQTKISFETGAGKRLYTISQGPSSLAAPEPLSANWTPVSGAGLTANRSLDSIIYFPANSAGTPQTFSNVDDDSVADLDIVFYSDGRTFIPNNAATNNGTSATVTIMTDRNKITKPKYQISITPAGRVLAQ